MKKIDIPIYNYKLYIFVGKDLAKAPNFFLKKKGFKLTPSDLEELKSDTSHIEAFVYDLEAAPGNCVLWISNPEDRSTLEHECMHIAIRIFEHIRCSIVAETEEPFAYLYEFVVKKCWEVLNSKKSNVPKNTSKEKPSI